MPQPRHRAAPPAPFTRLVRLVLPAALAAFALAAPAGAGKPEKPSDLPRVGASREVRLAPEASRFVRETALGGGSYEVWREKLAIPGAAFLKPRFSNFNLAPGDVLIVRAKSGAVVEELSGLGPKKAGSFWGLAVYGEELSLELRARARYTKPPFQVEQVIVGDARMIESLAPAGASAIESICAPEDYDDVVCYQGDAGKWANILASAGVMTAGGGVALWCSGSNVSPENYLLTNYHCIPEAGACSDSEFVFKYWRTGCNNNSAPTGDWVGYRCNETVASSPIGDCDPSLASLDFSLSSVVGDPAATFGFVTPDPTQLTSGERIYIVQHPDGRPHEIAHGEGADVVVDIQASTRTVRYYDTLDTEGGSSGSPIFRDSDDKMVGLHHCGGCETAGVGNRGMLMSDIYPQISSFICSPTVSLSVATPTLAEVTGNGDAFLDPGETWSIRPVLRNRACSGDATAVVATLEAAAGSAPVTLLDSAATFGTIAAGGSAPAQQALRFTINQGACAGEVALALTGVSSNGGQSHPGGEVFRQALGSVPTSVLLYENFAGGLPGSWTVVDGGTGSGAAATWTTANPGGRTLLVPPFAIADSDNLGSGQTMDEQLITAAVATTGFSHVSLELEHYFRYYNQGLAEKAEIDVRSTATGNNWVNLRSFAGADATGHLSVDLTPYVAANLQLRFHYYNAQYEWYWAIDDVTIRGDHGQVCAGGSFFSDGFETGNTNAWGSTVPVP